MYLLLHPLPSPLVCFSVVSIFILFHQFFKAFSPLLPLWSHFHQRHVWLAMNSPLDFSSGDAGWTKKVLIENRWVLFLFIRTRLKSCPIHPWLDCNPGCWRFQHSIITGNVDIDCWCWCWFRFRFRFWFCVNISFLLRETFHYNAKFHTR